MPSSRATQLLAARTVDPRGAASSREVPDPETLPVLDTRRARRSPPPVAPPVEPNLLAGRLVRSSGGVPHLPGTLHGARVSPPVLAVIGAAIVVVVALGSVVVGVLRTDSRAQPIPTRADRPSATASPAPAGSSTPVPSPSGPPVATAAAPPVPSGNAPDVVVHVVGEVTRQGVVTVPAGARVKDAVDRAGGVTRRAVLTGLNLARPVVDGEQIVVPDRAGAPVPVNTQTPPTGTPTAGARPPAAPGAPAAPLDLNTADQAALEALPEVGPVLAAKILEWRTTHGRFTSVDELGEVSGVGEKTLETLRPLVRV